ncbi:MocR-like pyridoxine biosynthesis transcription factor PdxR [Paraburkholderia acidisoli]|uniref:Aminotransferase class I/II-fold pyridoxal phosphate-dependent enzyme n=1 Tax=Paraburkholderia acidisoli TaxID=2571748 RepID=A0A7Z2GPD6_9BURK|nr:PLP-dependent aminotransferase family protein [Paraburkholderia acidisoli]QGZ65517.1 aminotransferase class I/II-fold pyridoxal phosphate-dependent enzyme [Paraburkholderia acidisoli]
MARGKTPVPLDLPLPAAVDENGNAVNKHDRAYRALRDAILERLLPEGARLPSSRLLAERWQLSRGTVESVFDRLRAEGYVTRLGGSGTRVCAVIPDNYLHAPPPRDAKRASAAAAKRARSTQRAAQAAAPEGARVGVPFVAKLANPRLFSTEAWVRHVQRAIASASLELLCSAQPSGMAPLREQIAAYLRAHRGVACHADDVIVTTGIRHAIDLIARSTLREGDKVCVEDPGYRAVHRIFELTGASLVHASVDAQGVKVDTVREHAGVRLAYVTPAHQSPLGVTMSATRRLALLEWAAERDAWIIEDDYDSDFRYQSAPLPALKAIDRGERVIYCGSFNQALFSNLRIGYMIAPEAIRTRILALWQTIGRSVGVTEQLGLAAFIERGALVQHLRVARLEYLKLRDIVMSGLSVAPAVAQGRARITGAEAGFHFILWLPRPWSEAAFCKAAQAQGVALQPLASLCHAVRLPPAVVIGYTALTAAQARLATKQLAALLT